MRGWLARTALILAVWLLPGNSLEEVRAFLDEYGRLHWGNQLFVAEVNSLLAGSCSGSECNSSASAAKPVTSPASCPTGTEVAVSYGLLFANVPLPNALWEGEESVLSCSEVFQNEAWGGPVVLNCTDGILTAQTYCGCARRPVERPLARPEGDKWEPGSSMMGLQTSETCGQRPLLDTQPARAIRKPGKVFPNAALLEEGQDEWRSCAELGAVRFPQESWTLSCVEGELVTNMTESCHVGGDSTSRRLVSVPICDANPTDEWWPSICGSLVHEKQTTVAGGFGNGSSQAQLDEPWGVTVDKRGNIMIADRNNHRLQLWPELAWENGIPGSTSTGLTGEPGNWGSNIRLNLPVDVVIGGCRDLYIGDEGSNRVVVHRPGYKVIVVGVGTEYSGPGDNQLDKPLGIAVTSNTSIFAADSNNHRVVRYFHQPPYGHWVYDHVFAGITGQPGSGPHHLNSPSDVFVDLKGWVYIADTGNNRILMMQKGGTPILVGGVSAVDSCLAPTSVHVDESYNVFATCSGSHCVRRWDWESSTGSYSSVSTAAGVCGDPVIAPLATNASYGASISRLNTPCGVYVDAYGSVLVSDTGNNRVLRFGRDPLSQWIVRNSANIVYNFRLEMLQFFTDLACTQAAPVFGFMSHSSAQGIGNLSAWKGHCLAGCDAQTMWLGNKFSTPQAVRCVKVRTVHFGTEGLDLTVQYWTGLSFRSWYEFGRIPSGQTLYLRLPRFDLYQSSCIKGALDCVLTDVIGDWQNLGDRIMMKRYGCSTANLVSGFANGGISDPATAMGTSFRIGLTGSLVGSVWIAANAHNGTDYSMCWCDSMLPGTSQGCTVPGDFTFLVGSVLVLGPYDDQIFYAYRGQSLMVMGLKGVKLAQGDTITAISGTCGPGSSPVLGLVKVDGSFSRSDSSEDGIDYIWPSTIGYILATPGSYALCWCRPVIGYQTCFDAGSFRAISGRLIVNGPNTGQNFACVRGYPCSISLVGLDISDGDSVDLQMASCGASDLTITGFPQKFGYNSITAVATQFSWGSSNVQAVAGLYYVCWCSVYTNCTVADEYRASVGILAVYAPEERDLECVLGRVCKAYQITGMGLGANDRLMIVSDDVCVAAQQPLPGFPGEYTGISYAATENGRTFVWGLINPNNVIAGKYHTCWCYREKDCTQPSGFITVVGLMTVRGPFQSPKVFVCGAGKLCKAEITGVDLLSSDKMVNTLGGCGPGNSLAVDGLTVAAATSVSTLVGMLHRWTSTQVPYGGEASVCWCGADCLTLADFNVYVGKLAITAPAQGVTKSCYSGLTCNIRLTGIGLQASNRLSFFTGQCATGEFAPGVPNSATSVNTTVVGIFNNVTDFSFGTSELPIRATGAIYSACWCSDGCTLRSEFIITVGDVNIFAPFSGHMYTCWQGMSCNITGVTGIGLSVINSLQITPLCGEPISEAGLPNDGKSLSSNIDENGTVSYDFSSTKVSTQPQDFELCWCSGVYPCDTPQSYVTKIGALTIGGPYAGQMRQCFVGQECALKDLKGLALRRMDRVIFLQTWCGAGSFVEGSPHKTWEGVPCGTSNVVEASQLSREQLDEDLKCADYLIPPMEGPAYVLSLNPQMYRMCWCSTVSGDCSETKHYPTDVGLVTVGGPTTGQHFNCVPGFICRITNALGVNLGNGDRWLVRTETTGPGGCKGNPMTVGFPDNGMSTGATKKGKIIEWRVPIEATTPPEVYTLCWCPRGFGCFNPEQYNALGGTVTVVGPLRIEPQTCAVGSRCVLTGITGTDLQNGDRIVVVRAKLGECGSASATTIEGFPNQGVSYAATLLGSSYVWPRLDTGLPGGTYLLCWCAFSRVSALNFECINPDGSPIVSDFRVEVGQLTVPGTPRDDLQPVCISGLPCTVDGVEGVGGAPLVDGAQIQMRKQLKAAELTDFCTKGRDFGVPAAGFPNDAISDGATLAGAKYQWNNNTKILAAGGSYIMCWRAPPPPEEFKFPVGILTVIGPRGDFRETCTMLTDCALVGIRGTRMEKTDKVMVLPMGCTADAKIDIPITAMVAANQIFWAGYEMQARAGKYSICWCYGQSPCVQASDFIIALGELTVRGPLAGQNRMCDRGLNCTVEGIAGFSLAIQDKAEVHVECGPGPRVPGFTINAGNKGSTTASSHPMGTGYQASFFKYSWPDLRAVPGIYRICWCETLVCVGSGPFSTEDFKVEVGIITVQGPADLTEATSIPERPLWGRDWKLILTGLRLYLAVEGNLRLLTKCGQCSTGGVNATNNPNLTLTPVAFSLPDTRGEEYLFDAGNMTLLNPGRQYCLCWCLNGCESLDNFKLDLGATMIYCAAGQEPVPEEQPTGCQACAISKFKETQENEKCEPCEDENHLTRAPGATHSGQCYCKSGMFSPLLGGACANCSENTYCQGAYRNAECIKYNFCPLTCEGQQEKLSLIDTHHICSSQDNCLINFFAYCRHTQQVPCPTGAGSWNDCLECEGEYPAWNVSSCSCDMGYEPRDGKCEKCELGFKKDKRGNASCTECVEQLSGSTTEGVGALECKCGDGRYLSVDPDTGDPVGCALCSTGYFCPGFEGRFLCPVNTTTTNVGSLTQEQCLCGAGFFKPNPIDPFCQPCAVPGLFYKGSLGDQPCDEKCPENSQIPEGFIGGPRAPETCLCNEGFLSQVDESVGMASCIRSNATRLWATETRVPAVTSYVSFGPVKPADVLKAKTTNFIRTVIATQLGLKNFDKVEVTLDSFLMPAAQPPASQSPVSQSRLLEETGGDEQTIILETTTTTMTTTTTAAGASMAQLAEGVGPTKVTIRVVIWQSTYREAKDMYVGKMDPKAAGNNTLASVRDVLIKDPTGRLRNVVSIGFNQTLQVPRLEYIGIVCQPWTGILEGTVFESRSASCQCLPGYEPQVEVPELERVADWDPALKCSPCKSSPHGASSRGYYKGHVGDERCTRCDRSLFTSSFMPHDNISLTLFAADSQKRCACPKGMHRVGDTCLKCPPGHYCSGDNTPTKCIINRFTIPKTGKAGWIVEVDCVCERGYFEAVETGNCTVCDPGYFKQEIGNGPGRCVDRCSEAYGFRSTSKEAATTVEDCYCQPQSFLKNNSHISPPKKDQCAACPGAGVECLGGFANTTAGNETLGLAPELRHMLPTALEGYWMIDASKGVATECKTLGVCLPSNECLLGQKGFICGTCEGKYTRDDFQKQCRSCLDLPETFYMIVQILGDLTAATLWNGFLTASAVSKTEAMKNILTVLLRMYTHWSSQVTTLFRYDVSSLTSMYADSETGGDQIDPLKEVVNVTNDTLAEEQTGLQWPSWQKGIVSQLMIVQGAVPSVGSTQEVFECLIDLHMESGPMQKYMKLVVPAVYWFMYPLIMISWTIMWAWILKTFAVGAFLVMTGEKSALSLLGISPAMKKRMERLVFPSKKKKQGANPADGESYDDPSSSSSDASLFSSDEETAENRMPTKTISLAATKGKEVPVLRDWSNLATVMNHLTILPNRFSRKKKKQSKAQEMARASQNEDDGDKVERILVFFKPDSKFKEMVTDDIAPWLVVTLNNVWVPCTNRLLQMLYCEQYPEGNVRLMMSTEVVCWSDEIHYHLSIIGIAGLALWSFGIVLGLYAIIKSKENIGELQSGWVQRTFGYLLEGYEPGRWYWELLWKKIDLLLTALISYTSVAPDVRAKILLFAVLSSVALTMQISYKPYDNRNVNLLDHVENFGLGVRFLVYWGVAICLVFDTGKFETMMIAGVVTIAMMLFLLQLFLYAADDWVTTQWNKTGLLLEGRRKMGIKQKIKQQEQARILAAKAKSKAKAKAKAKAEVKIEEKKADPEKKSLWRSFKEANDKVSMGVEIFRGLLLRPARHFYGVEYRLRQLVRFSWSGPTCDAVLYIPNSVEGIIPDEEIAKAGQARILFAEARGKCMKYLWGLDRDAQVDFAVDCIGSFAFMLIVETKMNELPARLTDILMLLATSIQQLRWDLLNNPVLKPAKKKKKKEGGKVYPPPPWAQQWVVISKDGRKGVIVICGPPQWKIKWEDATALEELKSFKGVKMKKGELSNAEAELVQEATAMEGLGSDDDDEADSGPMQQLKAMILRDIFERLLAESEKRREQLVKLKPMLLPMVLERLIPQELAWEVLDRMTTGQLEAALVNPAQVLLRIRFFVHLLQCNADSEAALNRIAEKNEEEENDRSNVMKFIEFTLRSGMENRSMHWDEAADILSTLPVEELRHLGNDPEGCFEMLERTCAYHKMQSEKEGQPGNGDDGITVEDLNNMLMFLAKFTYEELHEVLEYTQMLLDFLQLPCSDVWRGHAARVEALDNNIDELDGEPTYKQTLRRLEESCEFKPEDDLFDMDAEVMGENEKESSRGSKESKESRASSSDDRHGQAPGRNGNGGRERETPVIQGRYISSIDDERWLPTVPEDRWQEPIKPNSQPAARRSAAGARIQSSAGRCGVGLAGGPEGDESTHSSQLPHVEEFDDDDDDDDDVTVDSSAIGIDVRDIEIERNSTHQSWESGSLDFDDGYGDDGYDDSLSIGGRSIQSDISGLGSVLSSVLSRGGNRPSLRGEGPHSPHRSGRIGPSTRPVAPMPSSPPGSGERDESSSDKRHSGSQLSSNGTRPRPPQRPGAKGMGRSRSGANDGDDGSHHSSNPSDRSGGSNSKQRSVGSKEQISSAGSGSTEAAISKEREIQRMRDLLGED